MVGSCCICGVQQQSLCANCCNEKIQLIRNSVIDLDEVNYAAQQEINRVFSVSHSLQHPPEAKAKVAGGTINVSTSNKNNKEGDQELSDDENEIRVNGDEGILDILNQNETLKEYGIPDVSTSAIKVLTQQLIRLQIVNEKVKVIGMERTIDSLKRRNSKTTTRVEELRALIDQERNKLTTAQSKINKNFTEKKNAMESDKSFEMLKIRRVQKQALRFQQRHFNTLVEIVFSESTRKYDSYLAKFKGDNKKLMFFKQPIINIDSFFSYNHKLEQLNTFLESLIILQAKLKIVFDDELRSISLPYLKELEKLLPESNFFGLVKEKEAQMLGDFPNLDEEDEESDDQTKRTGQSLAHGGADEVAKKHTNNQVINLGDALRLPLSSKTINNQRRRSIQGEKDKDGGKDGQSDAKSAATSPSSKHSQDVSGRDKEQNTESKLAKEELNGKSNGNKDKHPAAKAPRSVLNNRKVVIIPHKIITKPFTKLTPKEFVKFLQVVVKILANFKVIFAHTKPLDEVYNFTQILEHISTMGQEYFERKLKRIESSVEETQIHSPMIIPVQQPISEHSLTLSAHTPSSSSISQLSSKKSSFSNLYSKIFGHDAATTASYDPANAPSGKTRSIISGGIFGNVSEMADSGSVDLEIKPHELQKDSVTFGNSTSKPEDELKVTMQRVYQIMARGGPGAGGGLSARTGRDNLIGSRFHLEEWDVISKML